MESDAEKRSSWRSRPNNLLVLLFCSDGITDLSVISHPHLVANQVVLVFFFLDVCWAGQRVVCSHARQQRAQSQRWPAPLVVFQWNDAPRIGPEEQTPVSEQVFCLSALCSEDTQTECARSWATSKLYITVALTSRGHYCSSAIRQPAPVSYN